MLLCTLVSSLGAVLGCVAVSLHFGDLSFSAAAIFFFPTILMEKFEQSRDHQSPKWLIAFADYSAQANMEFFCPKSYFSLGRENLIFFACSSYSVSLDRALWNWFVPYAKTITRFPAWFANPPGTGGISHFISSPAVSCGCTRSGYRPQLSPSHAGWILHHPGFHNKPHLTT